MNRNFCRATRSVQVSVAVGVVNFTGLRFICNVIYEDIILDCDIAFGGRIEIRPQKHRRFNPRLQLILVGGVSADVSSVYSVQR